MPYHSTIATALDKHKISSTVAYIPLLEVSITDTTTAPTSSATRVCASLRGVPAFAAGVA